MADLTSLNQQYFSKLAAEYDQRFGSTLVRLEQEIRNHKEFLGIKQGGRLLDYACGTGLLSRALGDDLEQCVGIDVTENMAEAYNARAKNEELWPNKRSAQVGNLILPSEPSSEAFSGPEYFGFDAAGVGAGFHHFDDCDLAARRLAERLRPGGVLFVMDFMPGEIEATAERGVPHTGFSEERMRSMFEAAGVGGDFAFAAVKEPVVFDHKNGKGEQVKMEKKVFFARGSKL